MSQAARVVVYPVKDLAKAKALYNQLLGTAPYVDQPYYVGYKLGDLELGLNPNGHKQGITGPVTYWYVADAKQSLEAIVSLGAQVLQDVKDVGGGMITAIAKDVDGNLVGLAQR